MKIIKRSKIRLILGKIYYSFKRCWDWNFAGKQFARVKGSSGAFESVVFRHETPLFRELPKVDLWLQQNKVKNLAIAVKKLHNLVVFPGETFSFWLLLGKPTKSKGYVEGFVLHNGRVEPGIGGGLCQLTNLIHWMTLHTPLTVVERWRHSYDVFPDANRSIPFGSGATCSYPSLDLQIKNNTSQPVQLCLQLSDAFLTGEWRSPAPFEFTYRVYEAFHEITGNFGGRNIRHNILRRRVFNGEQLQVADEFIVENQALMMYQPLVTATSYCSAI